MTESHAEELLTPADAHDIYPALARLRDEQPVDWCSWWGGWIVTRHADVVAGFRDPRLSADRAGTFAARLPPPLRERLAPLLRNLSGWALISDPPAHTRLRALVNKAFTPRLAEQLRPRIRTVTHELIDAMRDEGPVDLIPALANPLPVLVIGAMLGLPASDRHRLKAWSDALAQFLGAAAPTPEHASAALRCVLELEAYFREVIAGRRESPGPDLISGLLAAEENGSVLHEQELLSTCTMVLFGGHETTTNLIANAVHLLLTHPEQRARLQRDPSLLPQAIEETLRFESPVARMGRVATEDIVWHGRTIKADEKVWLSMASANRDGRQFPAPDHFDIARRDNRHLGLSTGPHYCVGAALGRAEAQIAVETLLRRFPTISLAHGAERSDNVTIRGFTRLPVFLGPESWAVPEDRIPEPAATCPRGQADAPPDPRPA